MGHKTMVIKIRIEPYFYESLKRCAHKMGYTTLSEFIRLSIREKINRECGEQFIKYITVELDSSD